MPNTGNVFVGVGEDNDGGGSVGSTPWTSPGNITSDNGVDATCNAPAGSHYLIGRACDFSSVPTNAIILGVTVRLEASEHSPGNEQLFARLQNDSGSLIGLTRNTTLNGTAKTVYVFGGPADLWGNTAIAASTIHAPAFGVRLWFGTSHDVRIDYVTIAIEYALATYPLPPALEIDAALAVGKTKVIGYGIAGETASAFHLSIVLSSASPGGPFPPGVFPPGVFPPDVFPGGSNQFIIIPSPAIETDSVGAGGGTSYDTWGGSWGTSWGTTSWTRTGAGAVLPKILKIYYVRQSDEADYAFSVLRGKFITLGRANETDTPFGLQHLKIKSIGAPAETDNAVRLARSKIKAVGLSTETDSAFALAHKKVRAAGLATETDTAFAVTGPKKISVGLAIETDFSISTNKIPKFRDVLPGIEADAAFAVSRKRTYNTSKIAAETDTAQPIVHRKSVYVELVAEADSAFSLTGPKKRAVGMAVETDSCLLSLHKRFISGYSVETDTAVACFVSKLAGIQYSLYRHVGPAPARPRRATRLATLEAIYEAMEQ